MLYNVPREQYIRHLWGFQNYGYTLKQAPIGSLSEIDKIFFTFKFNQVEIKMCPYNILLIKENIT